MLAAQPLSTTPKATGTASGARKTKAKATSAAKRRAERLAEAGRANGHTKRKPKAKPKRKPALPKRPPKGAAVAATDRPLPVARWPAAYRARLGRELEAHRAKVPAASTGELLTVLNRVHAAGSHPVPGLPTKLTLTHLRLLLPGPMPRARPPRPRAKRPPAPGAKPRRKPRERL